MDNEILVKIPASTANLGPGFDSIGISLPLFTTIKMKKAEKLKITLVGNEMKKLPDNQDNLIYKSALYIFQKADLPIPQLEMVISSEIPLGRGLGSSGSAIVGGLVAGNILAGSPFSKEEIFQMAARIEGHPDNVGASLFGGIVISAKNQTNDLFSYIKIEPPKGLKVVAAIPAYELPTSKARDILPSSYSREDTVHAISHAALLAGALAAGNTSLLYEAMSDRIHQPYRMSIIPGLEELIATGKDYGALGVALSGAGPTVIAFADRRTDDLEEHMRNTFLKHGVLSTTLSLNIDINGTQIRSKVQV